MIVFRGTRGSKSIWQIELPGESKYYGPVELLALHYYRYNGFPDGLHCEGALPITLFVTLFWEEIYGAHVSGAFATQYEIAPSDLFTGEFYANRKEKIDIKIQSVESLDREELSLLMENKLKTFRNYQSIMSSSLLEKIEIKVLQQFYTIVHLMYYTTKRSST